MKKIILLTIATLLVGGSLTACTVNDTATQVDQAATDSQLQRYQKNQPIPASDWSQYRQTVIDVEMAQIHGVATTTFFYNMGVSHPIKMCPSIGFAVASTSQLTNPDQISFANTSGAGWSSGVIGQQEPNGVYTGPSSGTYVVCVATNGTKYISYWEGDVYTEGGAAHYDAQQGMIVLDGTPTVTSTGK